MNVSFFDPMGLPKGVDSLLLSHLTMHEQLICSLVSRRWNEKITNDSSLWKAKATLLQSKPTKHSIALKIQLLSEIAKEHLFSLTKPVKTAAEFDRISGPIMFGFSRLPKIEQDTIMDGLDREIAEKMEIHKDLTNYLKSVLSLYSVKRVAIEKVEEAAVRLDEKFGENRIWLNVARTCLMMGQTEYAMKLLKSKIKDNEQVMSLLNPLIDDLCNEGKISDAIDLFKKYYVKNAHHDGFYSWANNCVGNIGEAIRQKKDAPLFELMIDTLFDYEGAGYVSSKMDQIKCLMKMLHEKGEFFQMKEVFYKYHDFFEECDPKWNYHGLIEIYFIAGQRIKAEEIAEKSKDNWAMYDVVHMYQQYAPGEEEERDRVFAKAKELAHL